MTLDTPKYKIKQQSLSDFSATITAKPNLTKEEIFQKFPEFNNDESLLQSAMDYHETSKSGKYKDITELNSKFPEFEFEIEDVKKKDSGVPYSIAAPEQNNPSFPGQVDLSQPISNDVQDGSVESATNIQANPNQLTTSVPDPSEDERYKQFMAEDAMGNDGMKSPFMSNLQTPPVTLDQNAEKTARKMVIDREDLGFVGEIAADASQIPPSFNKAFIGALTSIPKAVGILAKKMDDLTGVDNGPIENYSTYQLGQWIDKKALEIGLTAIDEKRAGFLNSSVPSAFGSMLGMIMTGGPAAAEAGLVKQSVGREFAKTLTSPMAFSGALQSSVPEYEAAKAAGKSDSEAFSVFLKNIPGGLTEVIPVANMFAKLNKITGNGLVGVIKSAAAQGLSQGLEEASQEAFQQYLTNQIAKGSYDPKRDLTNGVFEGASAGFVVGFLMPGIMSSMQNMSPADKSETKQVIADYLKAQEQNIVAPEGDLGVKPKVDEKPKGQVGKVDSKPLPEDIQKESVQVQAQQEVKGEEVKPKFPKSLGQLGYSNEEVKAMSNEEKGRIANAQIEKGKEVKPKESTEKFTVDVAKLQDDGSVKRIREEVKGKAYDKYPSLGLFSHPSVNTEGYYGISEKESGIQVVQAKTKKDAEQRLDDLVTRYGGEEAFKGVMAEQIVKIKKNQKAEETPEEAAAEISARKEDQKIAKQKIENPEIDETEIATREDAADEDTVIKQGEDVIRKATAVTNEEEAELSLDEIERTLTATEKKIKGLRDKYDTSDIPHEYPNKVVGKEAKKDIRKYVGVVSKYTGWEPTKLHDNIAPAGGDVSFTLSIPNSPYEMYAQVKYDPDYNNGYENYKPVEIFYRIENPNEKGQKKYAGPNQLIILDDSNRGWPGSRKFSGAAKLSPKDLAQIFIEEAKKFTGKKEATEIATQEGFDSPSHLINSVKKRTGQEFENVQDIPKEVINRVVNERNLEELPPAEEKPKITQIKEANPERILVVKPTSDIKGVTEIKYEDDGDTILYGAKNNKTRVSVKGLTKERIQEELDFERESLARIKKQVSEFDEQKILSSKGLSDQEKQDAIKLNKQTKNNIDAVEKIVIPFYESKIEPKAPRKSDAKFEKARKSAAELLDLIGPGLKLDEQYDPERSEKIA